MKFWCFVPGVHTKIGTMVDCYKNVTPTSATLTPTRNGSEIRMSLPRTFMSTMLKCNSFVLFHVQFWVWLARNMEVAILGMVIMAVLLNGGLASANSPPRHGKSGSPPGKHRGSKKVTRRAFQKSECGRKQDHRRNLSQEETERLRLRKSLDRLEARKRQGGSTQKKRHNEKKWGKRARLRHTFSIIMNV